MEGIPACGSRVGTRWSLRSLPTQTVLWYYGSIILWSCNAVFYVAAVSHPALMDYNFSKWRRVVSTAKEDTHNNKFCFIPCSVLPLDSDCEHINFLKQSPYFSIKYCSVRLNETLAGTGNLFLIILSCLHWIRIHFLRTGHRKIFFL